MLGCDGVGAANTTRGSVTGLAGRAARLGFTQNGGADVPLGGAWLSASYAYTHSQHVHAVTSLSSGASFSYDANGNMTGRTEGGRVYTQTFDAENRLVSVAQQGVGTTTYIYDGDGQLTRQVNPGGTGRLYLGVVEYDLNTNGTTAGSTSYYALPGARAVRNSAGLFYVLTDRLGSASVSLDHNGAVVAEMRYDAFGATRLAIGSMPGDRLYTGQVWAEVGLYYFNARWYSPYLNRFVSADTLIQAPYNPQSLSRYTFVFNNPLKHIDPSGHKSCVDWGPSGECIEDPDPSWVNPPDLPVSDLTDLGELMAWLFVMAQQVYGSGFGIDDFLTLALSAEWESLIEGWSKKT